MKVGIVAEIKKNERRVALTPTGAHELVDHGHEVVIESGAGDGSGFDDALYGDAGARIAESAAEVFAEVDMLVHVKEPQPDEIALLKEDQILFTYLHLAAYPEVASGLQNSGVTALAYETVQMPDGFLPLLAPMSRIAGKLSVQAGAHHLEAPQGGKGVLLGGDPGVAAGKVTIIGAGAAGTNALDMAVGLGARVTVLDLNLGRLLEIDELFGGRVNTVASSKAAVREWSTWADLVVGAVLVPGAHAPRLLTEEDVMALEKGSVLVDIAIDQGGCFATSQETTHDDPTFVKHDVVHFCVGNIPGAVPRTSTLALENATLPYVVDMADNGVDGAIEKRPELAPGLNVRTGEIVNEVVRESLEGPQTF
ncbi:MAG: alanine dehydrogenase [Acidimicrobiia bacterium]|nr:alanine dehydrogenase [Acidimicrobiia bacterium]